jgi:hypothetical protein
MGTLTFTTTFNTETCCHAGCGVMFAMGVDFMRRKRDDHTAFYCPSGHQMFYRGNSDLENTRAALDRANRATANARESRNAARQIAATERRSAAAYKGHLTRMRNRVAKGLCPQPGCKRSFTSLHKHVVDCHPDLVAAVESGATGIPADVQV